METAKRVILVLLVVAVMSFLVSAQKPAKDMAAGSDLNAAGKNMTFVQCVSDAAEVKNSCYVIVKDTLATCKTDAGSNENAKQALKQCNADYKKNKKQCKTDFKAKKNECKKIKHSFFDSMRVAFK